jgi:hypothetical protein
MERINAIDFGVQVVVIVIAVIVLGIWRLVAR